MRCSNDGDNNNVHVGVVAHVKVVKEFIAVWEEVIAERCCVACSRARACPKNPIASHLYMSTGAGFQRPTIPSFGARRKVIGS
jgi:hypothetical protein